MKEKIIQWCGILYIDIFHNHFNDRKEIAMSLISNLARMWLTHTTKPFLFSDDCDKHLSYLDEPKLGLYVHIPFCRTICSFCPYCKTVYDKEKADFYIQALKKEIDLVAKSAQGKKKSVTSLYFGGGSPALVCDDIADIIHHLQMYFDIQEGIGIELHPSDVTVQVLQTLKEAGVTKISIGVQSFQSTYLKVLGRVSNDFEDMFNALQEVSFETVSMDFIFALPNQTIDNLIQDIETAFAHGANHVAMYPFIDFSFTKREFPRMSNHDKKKLLFALCKYCEEKDYRRDSIWTFAKDDHAHYSSMTREQYLGFGCSATTLLHNQFKINTFSLDAYLEKMNLEELPSALTLRFHPFQRMAYYLFWSMYAMQVNEESFYQMFHKKLPFTYRQAFAIARLLGWVKKQDKTYSLTIRGSYYFHYFESFYTLSYIDQMWNCLRKEVNPKNIRIQ